MLCPFTGKSFWEIDVGQWGPLLASLAIVVFAITGTQKHINVV